MTHKPDRPPLAAIVQDVVSGVIVMAFFALVLVLAAHFSGSGS